jgi:alpha-mannosidase
MLRSIFTNRSRYNQLSRQIAFCQNQTYTIPAADEIVITKATTEVGQIQIAGRLLTPEEKIAARFTETVTIRSQSRLLEFDLTLKPFMEFDDDRWNSYIAVRYAWNDDTLEERGLLNDGMHVLPDRQHLHAPKVIDLRNEESSLTFLSEGLPFHRRSGERQLDTLLMVKGESHQVFHLGIAVNEKNPMFQSHDFSLGHEGFDFPVQGRPKNPSAWLFQIESKTVIALHWEAILESDTIIGYMVYLQETEGRRAHFALRSFAPPKHAAAMNLFGRELKKFKIKDDAVLIDMHANELLPLMVRTTDPQS